MRCPPTGPGPDSADRSGLERTALTLRSVERELIEATSETVLDRLEAASKPLEDLARDIRTRVTAMNAPAKTSSTSRSSYPSSPGF